MNHFAKMRESFCKNAHLAFERNIFIYMYQHIDAILQGETVLQIEMIKTSAVKNDYQIKSIHKM